MRLEQRRLTDLITPARTRRAGDRTPPILSMTMRFGLVDQGEKFKKRIASRDTSQYKVVTRGQLVVGFPIDEGVLAFQRLYDEAIVSPAYDVWDLHEPGSVDNAYLERFLRSPRALTFYAAHLRGSTARRRSLPDDIFLSLRVPLPPLPKQRRIAAILDQAEALRAKRRQSLARLDALTQSIFIEMFGDPVTNPKGWPVVSLSQILDRPLRNGVSPSSRGKVRAQVLTLGAITGDRFAPEAMKNGTFLIDPCVEHYVSSSDLLICRGQRKHWPGGQSALPARGYARHSIP